MVKVKKEKETEVEKLARITLDGFARMDKQFLQINNIHKSFIDRFDRIEADVKDIKGTLGFLVSAASEHERKFSQVETRLRRLEYKAGITKLENKK